MGTRLIVTAVRIAACMAMGNIGVGAESSPTTSDAALLAAVEADVTQREGDPDRGRALFAANRQATCATCHVVEGVSKGPGPSLATIGDKFDRRGIVRALLHPSAEIAVGYATTLIATDSGRTVAGVMQRAGDDWIELADQEGKLVRVPRDEIVATQASELSLMPEGLHKTLSAVELADLVAYLETRKQSLSSDRPPGMVDELPIASKPAQLAPFFGESVRLEHPTWVGQVPGSPDCFVATEHFGRSWVIRKSSAGVRQESLVDLSEEVRRGGATGLLGFAFHPKFPVDRRYYVKYQREVDGRISTVVDERRFAAEALRDSGDEPRELLAIACSTDVHTGGCIEFGPDGYLYIGMGDSGPQGDPEGHGQDLDRLLGKVLRIDVDRTSEGRPYAIPADNPLVGRDDARPEIWAYGFREPWRLTFDSKTHDLWVGDVGQGLFEEVAVVSRGENHGWNVFEGHAPFSEQFRRVGERFVPPVLSYSRRLGVSVTGGYVYRGTKAPAMVGWYVFADFESRRIWALRRDGEKLASAIEIARCPDRISSFMQDADGELYAIGYDRGGVYHLDLSTIDPQPLEFTAIADTAEGAPVPWRYTVARPADVWNSADFDDETWSLAPGGFGTQGTPGAIVRTEWRGNEIWLRREFDVNQPLGDLKGLFLRWHHDEDAEVYLNGRRIAQAGGWTSGYQDLALDGAPTDLLRAGRNVLAIHCRQNSGGQYIDAGLVAPRQAAEDARRSSSASGQ